MSDKDAKRPEPATEAAEADAAATKPPQPPAATAKQPKEFGGPSGPEPTRYGDWERKGIVSDF